MGYCRIASHPSHGVTFKQRFVKRGRDLYVKGAPTHFDSSTRSLLIYHDTVEHAFGRRIRHDATASEDELVASGVAMWARELDRHTANTDFCNFKDAPHWVIPTRMAPPGFRRTAVIKDYMHGMLTAAELDWVQTGYAVAEDVWTRYGVRRFVSNGWEWTGMINNICMSSNNIFGPSPPTSSIFITAEQCQEFQFKINFGKSRISSSFERIDT